MTASSKSTPSIQSLFHANQRWCKEIKQQNPHFFTERAKAQNPKHLIISCVDSRVVVEQICSFDIGDVLVHRNIANQANGKDTNTSSVVEFALEVLKIKSILIIGHTGCGGIATALQLSQKDIQPHNLPTSLLKWIKPIANWLDLWRDKEISQNLKPQKETRVNYLAKANVVEQISQLKAIEVVKKALKKEALSIEGLFYDLETGLLSPVEEE